MTQIYGLYYVLLKETSRECVAEINGIFETS